MAEQQLELFRSQDPRRVEICWRYHDAGYYWECPMCYKRPKVPFVAVFYRSSLDLKPEMHCGKCGAWYRSIPGDVDATNQFCIRYGYLFLGDAPDMPQIAPE